MDFVPGVFVPGRGFLFHLALGCKCLLYRLSRNGNHDPHAASWKAEGYSCRLTVGIPSRLPSHRPERKRGAAEPSLDSRFHYHVLEITVSEFFIWKA